ncbi:ABC transporter permease [Paenibacillus naphthalenovorans]|uniref:ABC transporter permease n=1 Tax=Paenibacillus naphthalenovorans TaxID=162209 RepID=UPI0008897023|nr:ABC transporter permease [Paenibacillus naphthalenovorans]SDJ16123.1 ribose transport system permease protein [Paenibacillus naphthalenovorans]
MSRTADRDFMRYSTLVALFAVIVTFSIISPSFLSFSNLSNILSQSAVLALVAVGLCFVIASGGIDLSIAVSFDIGAMVAVMLLKAGFGWLPAITIALAAGVLVGLFNSLLIVRVRLSPFLVTLGTLFIGESIEKIFTRGGEPVYFPGMSEVVKFLGRGSVFVFTGEDGGRIDIKFSIIIAIAAAIGAHFLLNRTVFGRHLYALGDQKEAAVLSGVPVNKYTVYAFVLSGVICSFAGIIGSSVLTSFVPLSGRYYLLDAIGAVFIGSALNRQGHANIPGTLIGVLFFGVVSNGLNLSGINFYWQSVARGVLIFLILSWDSLAKKRRISSSKSRYA